MTIEELQQEVRKVYPNAYIIRVMTVYFIKDDEAGNLTGFCNSQLLAWQSVFNRLKEQKKV